MSDLRQNLIVSFALRFLADNFDSEVQEGLDELLNEAEQPSSMGEEELLSIADNYAGDPHLEED